LVNVASKNVFLLQNKLVRKLFVDEAEGRKLNVPAAKVKVTVAKPTVPSSSKQHKKTVRIILLFITFDSLDCFGRILELLAFIIR
jgi:hypothetical protein